MNFPTLPNPLANFYQNGFVTNDLSKAISTFKDYGITQFKVNEAPIRPTVGEAATIAVALAWTGPLLIEIIQAVEHGALWREGLEEGPNFAMRLHHQAFRSPDLEQHHRLRDAYTKNGISIVLDGCIESSGSHYFYADTRKHLGGLYSEYIFRDGPFYEDVPRN